MKTSITDLIHSYSEQDHVNIKQKRNKNAQIYYKILTNHPQQTPFSRSSHPRSIAAIPIFQPKLQSWEHRHKQGKALFNQPRQNDQNHNRNIVRN